jgi:hypothetical protein
MSSEEGISTSGGRRGESGLDEASKLHPRPVVENSMKGEGGKLSQRRIEHPRMREIKRVRRIPGAVRSGGGGGENRPSYYGAKIQRRKLFGLSAGQKY